MYNNWIANNPLVIKFCYDVFVHNIEGQDSVLEIMYFVFKMIYSNGAERLCSWKQLFKKIPCI